MHLHNFNICSLMCLSFSNISNGSQWTGPHSLQINKRTLTATGTHNNFIFYQSLLHHASYLRLPVFKTVTMPSQTTQQNFTLLGLVAAILDWGNTLQQVVHEPHTSTHSIQFVYCYTPAIRTYKYLGKLHVHSMFLRNSLLQHFHKFLSYANYET